MGERVPTMKKIAVLRVNALGDFIFSLPAIQAIRIAYPHAEITLLGKDWHKEFLDKRPSPINKVIVVPPMPGIGERETYIPDKKQLQTFFSIIQREAFDVVVQIHGGGKYSNPFCKNIGARITIGLKSEDAVPLDRWMPYIYYQNEYQRYLEVVTLMNAYPFSPEPHLTATFHEQKEAYEKIKRIQQPFVIIHPGATDVKRRWGFINFARIGDFISKKGFTIIVTGKGEEQSLVKQVIQAMHYPAINMCNQLTLPQLTGLLSLATFVVSNDTGPLHLAYALGTPTIGLFWCGNMITSAPLARSLHRQVISWQIYCTLCGADCASIYPIPVHTDCKHEVSFLSKISLDEVKETITHLLSFLSVSHRQDLQLVSLLE